MINVVGKIPMMEVVDRMVTFLRATESINPPARKEEEEVSPQEPENVPMMNMVHKTISFLKTSERDHTPAKRKLYDPELTVPEQRICRKIEFDLNAAYFLKEQTRHPLELLELGYTDEDSVPAGIFSMADHTTARKIIKDYQDRFISQEKYLFIADHSLDGDQVAMIDHCTDPYKIIELSHDPQNQGLLKTEDIIAKLRSWHERFGIRITGIGLDFCEAEILNKAIDYKALAEEINAFHPLQNWYKGDTIEQLEEEMKKEGTICLCWN